MLERVSLPGSQNKRVDQLSGGQKQRVAIARCLVLEPTLLLLDEPLGALDLKLREHMKIELKQLQADFGTTFVYITHDQSEALVLSDHVAVMNKGRFEQVGTPQSLYYEPQTPFVAGFVGANNRIAGPGQPGQRRPGRADHRQGPAPVRPAHGRRSQPAPRPPPSCGRKSRRWRATSTRLPADQPRLPGHGGQPAVRRRQFRGAGARAGSPAPSSTSRCRRPGSSPTWRSARPSPSASTRNAPCVSRRASRGALNRMPAP